jgi:pilus assembly protein Flp/PilA
MKHLILKFLENESGATAIEYSLIATGIAVVIVTAVNGVGSTLNDKFISFSTALTR